MKRRSAIARDLRTPKYRPRVVKAKKKAVKRLTKKEILES